MTDAKAQKCERCKGTGGDSYAVPGSMELCQACNGTGRTQEPSVDVRRCLCNEGFGMNLSCPVHSPSPQHIQALTALQDSLRELVAARAEIERLKANDNRRIEIGNELQAEIATLRAENEGMREALDSYGEHRHNCLGGHYNPGTGGPHDCDCGFDAALGRGK